MLIRGLGSPGLASTTRGGLGGLGLGGASGSRAVFSLLKDGAGQATALTSAQFAAAYASELAVGSYWMLHGDGTSQAGGSSWTPGASAPTTVSNTLVPSGTDGTTLSTRRYTGAVSCHDAGPTFAPTGDFSVIMLVRPHFASGSNQDVASQFLTTGNSSWIMRLSTTLVPSVQIGNGVSFTAATFGSALTPRSWNLVVATYSRTGGAADNVGKIYVNGSASVVTSSVMNLALNSATATARIGALGDGSNRFTGDIGFVAYTSKVLSADTIQAMAQATSAAPLTGAGGETTTFTRSSLQTAETAAGEVVTIHNARPIVAQRGYLSEPAITQRAIQNETLSNAAWTATNVTVTADTHAAPDGTLTADTLAGTGAGGMIESTTAFAPTGVRATVSCWVRSTSGTQAGTIVLRDTTAGADLFTISYTATTTWQRVSGATDAATSGNNQKIQIYPGGAGTGTTVCWGVNHEINGIAPSSHVRTEAVNIARSASVLTVPTTGWPTAAGEIRCVVMLPYGLNGQTQNILSTVTGNSGVTLLININTTLTCQTGNGTSFSSTTSGALTWTAGVRYALRVRWGGGTVDVYRDGVSVATGSSKNMPDQHVANGFLGCNSGSAGQLSGYLSDFEVFR
jgi:hypothetical protein